MDITMRFTKRDRYCRAINHLWNHPEKYVVICRGRDYRSKGWYVGFVKI